MVAVDRLEPDRQRDVPQTAVGDFGDERRWDLRCFPQVQHGAVTLFDEPVEPGRGRSASAGQLEIDGREPGDSGRGARERRRAREPEPTRRPAPALRPAVPAARCAGRCSSRNRRRLRRPAAVVGALDRVTSPGKSSGGRWSSAFSWSDSTGRPGRRLRTGLGRPRGRLRRRDRRPGQVFDPSPGDPRSGIVTAGRVAGLRRCRARRRGAPTVRGRHDPRPRRGIERIQIGRVTRPRRDVRRSADCRARGIRRHHRGSRRHSEARHIPPLHPSPRSNRNSRRCPGS